MNFLVPSGMGNGAGKISVFNSAGGTVSGSVQVAAIAPAIYTSNFTGQGPAAANLLRVKPDGTQSQWQRAPGWELFAGAH